MRQLGGITDSMEIKEQASLECCSPWGHKELDTTEQLNSNKIKSQEQIRRKTDNIRIPTIYKRRTKMKQKCTNK